MADDDLAGSSNDKGDGDADMINKWDDTTGVLNQSRGRKQQRSSDTAVEEGSQAPTLAELKACLEEVLPGNRDDIAQQ